MQPEGFTSKGNAIPLAHDQSVPQTSQFSLQPPLLGTLRANPDHSSLALISEAGGLFTNKNLTLLNHAVEPLKEAPGLWAPGTQGSPSLCEPRALQFQLTAPPNSGLNRLKLPLPPSSDNVTKTAAWPAPRIFQIHGTFPCSDVKPRVTLGARADGGGC